MTETPRVYLDYAAATPLLPAAKAAMEPYLEGDFGNPSAIHAEGVAARRAVEAARADIAGQLEVKPETVSFTSGGTESNNLAIIGTIEAAVAAGRSYEELAVVSTAIEHPSIERALEWLATRGVEVRTVRVNETGLVDLVHLAELCDERVILFTCAYANSEIGVVQPVRRIARTLTAAGEQHDSKIAFHFDAAQAPLWLNCQFAALGADLVSFDFAKCHGPKGVGCLVRARNVSLRAVQHGGGQETGLRPGTENVPGIVGAAVAFVDAQANWRERSESVASVRDAFITALAKRLPAAILNGPVGSARIANNINISIPGLDTEFAAVVLDRHGFAVSTKSACAGAGGGESTVVRAISDDPARAASTLRITLGPTTTEPDLERLIQVLQAHIQTMQHV